MSLILDGREVQNELAGVYLSIARGRGRHETPPARTVSSLIPFRAGRRPSLALHDTRSLELVGWITLPVEAELAAEVDTLKAILDPGRLPWIMQDTRPDGSMRWIQVVGRNVLWRYRNPHTYDLSAELLADDPFWYSAYGNSTLDSGLFLDDGQYLDQGGEIIVTPTSTSHALNFDSGGTADVERIRLRFVGPSSAAVGIEVDTPDGVVGFVMASALTAGQTLLVDNYARTAVIAAASQRPNMTLGPANRQGEYVRFLAGVNHVRVLGQPVQASILLTPTFL